MRIAAKDRMKGKDKLLSKKKVMKMLNMAKKIKMKDLAGDDWEKNLIKSGIFNEERDH